jgi:Uma2 family endonuclease
MMDMSAIPRHPPELGYSGLRMTADEYLALGETEERYELIDGVVVMSPSSAPGHGEVANEIGRQLGNFARTSSSIRVFQEIDVRLNDVRVVRPDICVYLSDRLPKRPRRFDLPPDLIVEVLSPGTKPLDLITKRDDYEKFGVREYWVVDPTDGRVRCWRRQGLQLTEAPVETDFQPCPALPGFSLDLKALRSVASE